MLNKSGKSTPYNTTNTSFDVTMNSPQKKQNQSTHSKVRRLTLGKFPASTQIQPIYPKENNTLDTPDKIHSSDLDHQNINEAQQELFFYKNWARFADIMQIQNGQTSEDWGNHLLSNLVPFVKGFQAALYLKAVEDEHDEDAEPESYRLIGGYALDMEQMQQVIHFGEGTVGQAAKSRKKSHITHNSQENQFKAIASTIEFPVHAIVTLPIIYQEEVFGVLEILFYRPVEEKYLDFLHKINSNIGANLCLFLKDEQINLQNQYLNHQLQQTRNHLIISEEFRKIHTNLTESVMYASNIQAAILPSESSFEKLFNDYFIIYKPKDIVSGDFYWLAQVIKRNQDNKSTSRTTFLAVVDCTGHGVPGAFMSMIGNMLLNEIVSKKGITDPAQILKMLHIGIRSSLKQSQGHNKDGMDVCLCKIVTKNKEEFKITFAGAKRQLYYTENGQLFKKKGTRRSIGGDTQVNAMPFANEVLELTAGEKLFLSTDGFKDVASPKRRNFGLRKLETLLQEGIKQEMAQHRELLLTQLREHQQNTAQRDDITLIGIQL